MVYPTQGGPFEWRKQLHHMQLGSLRTTHYSPPRRKRIKMGITAAFSSYIVFHLTLLKHWKTRNQEKCCQTYISEHTHQIVQTFKKRGIKQSVTRHIYLRYLYVRCISIWHAYVYLLPDFAKEISDIKELPWWFWQFPWYLVMCLSWGSIHLFGVVRVLRMPGCA